MIGQYVIFIHFIQGWHSYIKYANIIFFSLQLLPPAGKRLKEKNSDYPSRRLSKYTILPVGDRCTARRQFMKQTIAARILGLSRLASIHATGTEGSTQSSSLSIPKKLWVYRHLNLLANFP